MRPLQGKNHYDFHLNIYRSIAYVVIFWYIRLWKKTNN
jgi:hypothetical protein